MVRAASLSSVGYIEAITGPRFAAYVNKNPAAFVNAYFDVEWLKIYE